MSWDALPVPFKDCTPELCGYENSFYMYRIEIVPNAVFLGMFGFSLLAFLAVYIVTRRGATFTIAMVLGLLCEMLGYGGRILSWKNQWSEPGFLMQICCLTIAPAFLAAGIYLCIRKIVFAFGPENSRIPPEYYTRFFIPCDVVSLILQAVGGALASVASHNQEPTETGDNIMIAGLAFQVFTLFVFIVLCTDFTLNTLRRKKALGASALDQNPELVALRGSWMFRGFLVALGVSTITIFWRCVFRVAELSGGWTGPLMERQDLFIGFEGVMITIAVYVLNIFHPSLCFKQIMDSKSGLGSSRKDDIEVREAGPLAKPSTTSSFTDGTMLNGESPYTSAIERAT
ncbi:RTA1-domain-containing protein [Xylariomycetidae sp. FL2044]|nr:RTA1-domain-containing protein [Xylariomycetidae sp. FL2044]